MVQAADNQVMNEGLDTVAGMVKGSLRELDRAVVHQIIDSVADPLFVKDEDLNWILVNQAFCDFIGHRREELLGRSDAAIFPAEEAAVFNAKDREVFRTQRPNVNEELLTSAATGEQHIIRTTKTMFVDDAGRSVLVGIFTDLTELRRAQRELEEANARLQELALVDPLSELPNRRAFDDALRIAVAGARRNGRTFSLLYLDLDGFKQVNDELGHQAGDELIHEVARRLVSAARENDFVARMGGDEFVLIAADTDRAGAGVLARRINDAIAGDDVLRAGRTPVGVSIGIAAYPLEATDAAGLLQLADQEMYRVKQASKRAARP